MRKPACHATSGTPLTRRPRWPCPTRWRFRPRTRCHGLQADRARASKRQEATQAGRQTGAVRSRSVTPGASIQRSPSPCQELRLGCKQRRHQVPLEALKQGGGRQQQRRILHAPRAKAWRACHGGANAHNAASCALRSPSHREQRQAGWVSAAAAASPLACHVTPPCGACACLQERLVALGVQLQQGAARQRVQAVQLAASLQHLRRARRGGAGRAGLCSRATGWAAGRMPG